MIGRPFQNGRPKVLGKFQELAREHTIEALQVLIQIMLNEEEVHHTVGSNPTLSASVPLVSNVFLVIRLSYIQSYRTLRAASR